MSFGGGYGVADDTVRIGGEEGGGDNDHRDCKEGIGEDTSSYAAADVASSSSPPRLDTASSTVDAAATAEAAGESFGEPEAWLALNLSRWLSASLNKVRIRSDISELDFFRSLC